MLPMCLAISSCYCVINSAFICMHLEKWIAKGILSKSCIEVSEIAVIEQQANRDGVLPHNQFPVQFSAKEISSLPEFYTSPFQTPNHQHQTIDVLMRNK